MDTDKYPRVVTAAAFLVAVAAGVYTALLIYNPVIRPVLDVAPPFVIAIALALLLDPLLDRFERRGMSRGLGVAVVGLSFAGIFLLGVVFLAPKIAQQATALAANFQDYAEQARSQINVILQQHEPALEKLHLPTTTTEWTSRFSGQLQGFAGTAVSFFATALTNALSRVLWLVIIPLATLWLLRDIDYIKAKLVRFTPESHRERVIRLTAAVGVVFGKYLRGMLTVAILFSLAAMLVLTLFGLDYALIIGAVAGLFYLVPYIGVFIMAVITGLAALVQPPHSASYALILMGVLAFQSFVVFDLGITPRIVGGSVGVHPVLALFSLALGARLFGVVGMVAAVPVAASLQVAIGQLYPQIHEKARKPREMEAEPAQQEDST